MKKKNKQVSAAASILGSMTSPKKRRTSAANGRLGGRPSSGLCSDRELRRRLRAWCRDNGGFSLARYRVLCEDALAWRWCLMHPHPDTGFLASASDIVAQVTNHPLSHSTESWRLLLLQNPILL